MSQRPSVQVKRTKKLVPGRPARSPNHWRSRTGNWLPVVPCGYALLQAIFTKWQTHALPSGSVTVVGEMGRPGTSTWVGRNRIGLPLVCETLATKAAGEFGFMFKE
jgi:hypothetical protein